MTPLDPHAPLWPQLVMGVPLWTNGRVTYQQPESPGTGFFRISINQREHP